MRAIVEQKPLLEALKVVAGVIPTTTPQTILQAVRLEFRPDGTATVRATNNDIHAEFALTLAGAETPGVAVIPFDGLHAFVARVDGDLVLTNDGGRFRIESAQADRDLPTEDPDLYPSMPDVDLTAALVLPAPTLARLIDRSVFACDGTSARFALGGVVFDRPTPTSLRAVATDTRKMGIATEPCEVEGEPYLPSDRSDCAVPEKALNVLRGMLGRAGAESARVGFCKDRGLFAATVGGFRLASRVLSGVFPNWSAIVPPDDSATILETGTVAAVRRAIALVTGATSKETVGMVVEFGRDRARGTGLLVYAESAANGKAAAFVPLPDAAGKRWHIVLNARYAAEGLDVAGDRESLQVRYHGPETAILFRFEGFDVLVMPLSQEPGFVPRLADARQRDLVAAGAE
jgi:DNA polymerase-3 subunit beta